MHVHVGKRKWSAHDVELALWSFSHAKSIKPTVPEDKKTSDTKSSESDDIPPKKKLRHV